MKVYVNDEPVDVVPGMKVRHALLSAGVLKGVETSKKSSKKVYDEWGNELGLEGALAEGMKIYLG